MKYTPKHTDYILSPFTGLTRKSWRDAGIYLLKGLFDHLTDIDAPPLARRTETEVTYPHLNDSEGAQEAQRKAEIFEGLTRTLFIASVLIADEPDLSIGGICLRDYYRLHILRCCTDRNSPEYAGSYEEMAALTKDPDPFRPYQQTVETCALVIGLMMCREAIWEKYSKEEKDAIAAFLTGYAHANTVPQNWRLFNMLDMAFLYQAGYPIDEHIMLDHAQAVLAYDAGDGWYRDGHSFDYYSCWAFNFYAPLWNRWYGYEKMPSIAKAFEDNSNRLMKTYGRFFGRNGFVNMWGRSCIYRNAATSAFDGNLFLNHPTVDPGWARRISSGALLQFLSRDDFLAGGAPSLGFYGQFTPLVQGYSCAESPYWLGKAFLCLHLPEDHPFWTAEENEGDWPGLGEKEVLETVLNGPALAFTNHAANGETILRTGKVVKREDDLHGMWNYGKLCYNTAWPWESAPKDRGFSRPVSVPEGEEAHDLSECAEMREEPPVVESQQYVLTNGPEGIVQRGNVTLWCGQRQDVLYRRQFFGYTLDKECHWMQAVNLADIPVPFGILRADKMRLYRRPTTITLGAYGFPDNNTTVRSLKKNGAHAIVLSGCNSQGRPAQLAMTIWDGFRELKLIKRTGTNPDSPNSIIIYAQADLVHQYDASEPYVFISQVITRDDGKDFSEDDIFPIREIHYADETCTGACGPVRLLLNNGRGITFDYDGLEACLSL